MSERERINEKTKEVMEKVVKQINKERQQIIFEHYVKVREECYLNLRKDGYLECEKCKCHGECFFTELYYCSDDQLKAFIEKVEGGE